MAKNKNLEEEKEAPLPTPILEEAPTKKPITLIKAMRAYTLVFSHTDKLRMEAGGVYHISYETANSPLLQAAINSEIVKVVG